ncbi:MAG TPA: hypothetical protein VFJ87_03620 [Rhodanobacteraceae bacterium]|nr:hypothetical protein [Rhodanobacteraceae bacterium]
MPFPIATVALLISGTSLGCGIYQYRILDRVRTGEKANTLLRAAYELQRRSEELRRRIACTDHVTIHDAIYAKINDTVDVLFTRITSKGGMPWKQLHNVESRLMRLEPEVRLLFLQFDELDELRTEMHELKSERWQEH